jgi:hypothetical protein
MLCECLTRLHALVHAVTAAAANALTRDSHTDADGLPPQHQTPSPLSVAPPSPSDVRAHGQQLQFRIRDMIVFTSSAHGWASKGEAPCRRSQLPQPLPLWPSLSRLKPPAVFASPAFALASRRSAAADADERAWVMHPSYVFGSGISSTASAVTSAAAATASAAAAAATTAATATANAVVTAIQSETMAAGISTVGTGVTGPPPLPIPPPSPPPPPPTHTHVHTNKQLNNSTTSSPSPAPRLCCCTPQTPSLLS